MAKTQTVVTVTEDGTDEFLSEFTFRGHLAEPSAARRAVALVAKDQEMGTDLVWDTFRFTVTYREGK